MQGTDTKQTYEPAIEPLDRCIDGNGQRVRKDGCAVVPRARDDRREGAIVFLAGGGERLRQRRGAQWLAARLGQHDRFGLDGGKRCRGVRPTDFDDREGAFGAQCRNDIHGRAIGNDDKRTLQRHVQIQAGRMQD